MLDDGHEDLFGGVWPFIKRVLFVFLPLWVAMIIWYGGRDYINHNVLLFLSAICAGLTFPAVQLFEKLNLLHLSRSKSDRG
ncbi:MAG: hypothetical protein CMB37_04720 [Euryarchaeota archaeon]|nr:hypothetical protein [Euryarchaeota archaeon]|tara:strand:- start:1281 stop:1523 length:243 start_codon:yes stop_codon:yes gene_type:complete